jgi:hypothetical protein
MSSIVEAASVPSQLLGELFVQKGLITHEELELALAEQKVNGKRLGEILVKMGFVSGPALTTVLAEQLGVEMETQEGFGSGLWSEIKRRHHRDRPGNEQDLPPEVVEPEPAAGPRLVVFDGLFQDFDKPEVSEPAADVVVVDGELQALRQQLSFAAERLDEERAAHEGTQRLLDETRAEAEAHSREAEDWRERAARAEDPGQATQAARAELAELEGIATDLRSELAAREEALRHATAAQTELAGELAGLQAELADLRDGRAAGDDQLSALTKQLEDERAAHEVARAELAAREEELQHDTEAEAELEAGLARLQADLSTVTKQLEDERAAYEAAHTELVRRDAVAAEHADQLRSLRDELAARAAARDREADARVAAETEAGQLRADALVLHQRLDDERAENVALRREVGRVESQLSEIAPIVDLLDEAERDLAARTDELAELALELEHVRGLLAERDAASPVEEIVAGHIVFRPGAGGYVLVERPGPAPEVGNVEDVDGERFLVTRIGRSPLPTDRRRCAYLEAA